MREVREREVTGESESEGERESDIFYLNDCGVQMTKLWKKKLHARSIRANGRSIRVLQSFPLKEISSRDLMELLNCKKYRRVGTLVSL